jgi:hypothetical protein
LRLRYAGGVRAEVGLPMSVPRTSN